MLVRSHAGAYTTWPVQSVPSHHRQAWSASGSRYQPAEGARSHSRVERAVSATSENTVRPTIVSSPTNR